MNKVILLDIDGTLLNDEKVLTPKTKEALLKAQKEGATLVLASGRPDQGLVPLAKELEMDKNNGIFISFNGAKVSNCQTGEVYFNQCMDIEDAKEVLEHIKQFEVRPMIAKGEYMYTDDVFGGCLNNSGHPKNIIQYESRGNNYLLCEEKDMAEFVDFPVEKILTLGEPEYLQEHYKEMQAPFKDKLSCMFTAPFYYEYTAKDVDKAKAAQKAFESLGYKPEDLIAFGDAQNDISMLKYVGLGIAMGNAVEETKAAADYVTLDNNHDGIAAALDTFLFNK